MDERGEDSCGELSTVTSCAHRAVSSVMNGLKKSLAKLAFLSLA